MCIWITLEDMNLSQFPACISGRCSEHFFFRATRLDPPWYREGYLAHKCQHGLKVDQACNTIGVPDGRSVSCSKGHTHGELVTWRTLPLLEEMQTWCLLDTLLVSRGLEISELVVFHYLSTACLSRYCKQSFSMWTDRKAFLCSSFGADQNALLSKINCSQCLL